MRRADWWLVAAVTVSARAALGLAAWLLGTPADVVATPDGQSYLQLADGLRAHASFGVGEPHVYRPPLFPALLACCSIAANPVLSAVTLNVLLSVALALVVSLTAADLAGRRAGLAAGCILALSPDQLMWSVSALAEVWLSLAVAIVGLALLRWQRAATSRRAGQWFLVAVCAGVGAAYAKIIGYPLAVALPFFGVLTPAAARPRRVAIAAGALLVAALALGAWHIRNGTQTGYWGFSTQFARAALFTVAAGVEAQTSGAGYVAAREHEAAGVGAASLSAAGDERRVGAMWARAAERVAGSPVAGAYAYARGVAPAVIDPGSFRLFELLGVSGAERPVWSAVVRFGLAGEAQQASSHLVSAGVARAGLPLLLVGLLGGLWYRAARGFLAPEANRWRWIAFGLVTYLLALSGGPAGSARFRVPAVPVLAVLAGVSLAVRPGAGGDSLPGVSSVGAHRKPLLPPS